MISPGLEDRTSNYKLDVDQEWSPARAEPTGYGTGPETIYTRGKASDHMAQKATVILDLVEKGKAGNRAIINYNNREGWKLYTIISNEYAPEIMRTVRLYEHKNERQKAFKQIMHEIDIKCFGVKYKKK